MHHIPGHMTHEHIDTLLEPQAMHTAVVAWDHASSAIHIRPYDTYSRYYALAKQEAQGQTPGCPTEENSFN